MIRVVACGHPGAVDLIDSHAAGDADPVHLSPAEWQEFLAAVRAGKYDDLAGRPADG